MCVGKRMLGRNKKKMERKKWTQDEKRRGRNILRRQLNIENVEDERRRRKCDGSVDKKGKRKKQAGQMEENH